MPTPELRDVGIILQVLENKQYDLLEVTPADILFQRFRSSLAGQDWMRLVKCLARFPALQTLRLEMELQPYPIARGRLSSDIPGCICVTQEVAAASLPAAVLAMAKVSVVLGYCA
ncbi:uncharacterized protein PHACADRAFT_257677 [Phanerochaete carnosa HHB-10118-sp]|uniref:Uncharacterized protein n=1 Tax=Phanerochaete carnosa (strain HHB-10118-sp) TaxID=650164 RepID=K5W552_PHACS|nr:uncharacterized protein PHACADRAFT_257677 [Phanerochaete carnosa HHB-10118-sp]EKM54074.1 hypothetical protein PHACADRAFT_257677 [Phanerochaete carnosa HHB-10118-sp]